MVDVKHENNHPKAPSSSVPASLMVPLHKCSCVYRSTSDGKRKNTYPKPYCSILTSPYVLIRSDTAVAPLMFRFYCCFHRFCFYCNLVNIVLSLSLKPLVISDRGVWYSHPAAPNSSMRQLRLLRLARIPASVEKGAVTMTVPNLLVGP
ncbi:hypothetical protein ACJJTC_018754 [Scirpophaga incertulas]